MSTTSTHNGASNVIDSIRNALAARGRTDTESASPLAERMVAALEGLDERASERILAVALAMYDGGRVDGEAIGSDLMRGATEPLEEAA